MARVVKEHDVRRNELLDVAQELFCTNGYEQTPISAIIDRAGVAKGTFYHYFPSKTALVAALAARVSASIIESIERSIAVPDMTAIERFNTACRVSARWKADNLAIISVLLAAMYHEDNLVLRHHVTARIFDDLVPLLARIIAQGLDEKTFDTPDPTLAAETVVTLTVGLRERLARPLVESFRAGRAASGTTSVDTTPPVSITVDLAARMAAACDFCQQAIERVLGIRPGTLDFGTVDFLARFAITIGTCQKGPS